MVAVKPNKTNSYMKTIFKSAACLSFLLALAACQQFQIDTQMTPEKEAASIRLECDALESYTISATVDHLPLRQCRLARRQPGFQFGLQP